MPTGQGIEITPGSDTSDGLIITNAAGSILSTEIDAQGDFQFIEKAAPAGGTASQALCYADSTAHMFKCSYNNGTFGFLDLASATSTTANFPYLTTTTAGVETPSAIAYPTSTLSGAFAYANTTTSLATVQLTSNRIVKAGGASAPSNSSITDDGTTVATAEPFKITEGAAAGAGAALDTLHADSTQHAFTVNNNNTGEMAVSRVGCVNVTPVTVAASVTTDQNLQACSFSANLLNVVGRTIRIWTAGVYSTAATSTAQITLKAKLCTVSGCGSGTVIALDSIQTVALGSVTIANNAWNLAGYSSTQTAGATAAFETHGRLSIDLGALTTAADSTFNDINTATIGTIDSTASLFLQISGAYSAASTSNSMTGRQLIVEVVD